MPLAVLLGWHLLGVLNITAHECYSVPLACTKVA